MNINVLIRWTSPDFQALHLHASLPVDWNSRGTLSSLGQLVTADVNLSNASSLSAAALPDPVFPCCGVRWISQGGGGGYRAISGHIAGLWMCCWLLFVSQVCNYFIVDSSDCDRLLNSACFCLPKVNVPLICSVGEIKCSAISISVYQHSPLLAEMLWPLELHQPQVSHLKLAMETI